MVDESVRVAHNHCRLVQILPDRVVHRDHRVVLNRAGEEHTVKPRPAMSVNPEMLSFEVLVEKNHVLLGGAKHFRVAAEEAAPLSDSKVHIKNKIFGQLPDLSDQLQVFYRVGNRREDSEGASELGVGVLFDQVLPVEIPYVLKPLIILGSVSLAGRGWHLDGNGCNLFLDLP